MRNTCAHMIPSNPIDSAKRFLSLSLSLLLRRPLFLPPSLSLSLSIYLSISFCLSFCFSVTFSSSSFSFISSCCFSSFSTPPFPLFPFSVSVGLSLSLPISFSLVYASLYHLTSLSDYYTVRKGISSSLKTRSVSVRVTRPVDSYGTRKYARPFLVCILVSSSSLFPFLLPRSLPIVDLAFYFRAFSIVSVLRPSRRLDLCESNYPVRGLRDASCARMTSEVIFCSME